MFGAERKKFTQPDPVGSILKLWGIKESAIDSERSLGAAREKVDKLASGGSKKVGAVHAGKEGTKNLRKEKGGLQKGSHEATNVWYDLPF